MAAVINCQEEERRSDPTEPYKTIWNGPSSEGFSQSGSYTVFPSSIGEHRIEVEMVLSTSSGLIENYLYQSYFQIRNPILSTAELSFWDNFTCGIRYTEEVESIERRVWGEGSCGTTILSDIGDVLHPFVKSTQYAMTCNDWAYNHEETKTLASGKVTCVAERMFESDAMQSFELEAGTSLTWRAGFNIWPSTNDPIRIASGTTADMPILLNLENPLNRL